MDYIDEILFKNRDKVKRLITANKRGQIFAQKNNIPFERLSKYKDALRTDMRYCTESEEVYTNYEEFRFRTSQQIMNPHKYKNAKSILFKDLSDGAKIITEEIKKLSRVMRNDKDKTKKELKAEEKPLNPSEELFVQHYLVTRSAAKAAERAGYQGTAVGHDMINRPHIQRAVTMQLAQGLASQGVTVESVLANIALIRDRAMSGHPVLDQDGVYLGEWKCDYAMALKASELEGKYLKMFTDRMEVTGKNGGPIQHQVEVRYDYSALTIEELEEFKRSLAKVKIIEPKKVNEPVDVDYKVV